ncbi:hypothetical protein BDP55DRAFT_70038 [Colletotrichum godetiae]|uniref:Uncharacterized protein n=1 Tax=Colletotrichum godetiae TaxID=1209918 RepID=A0AAJ0A584_9PEZI|nr:uncharacterized protein BDP55DRAFT_70038 [Colletotrichum godetiae]KAK1656713.1 hypothetical protein BDP55DRAFT_70038 [Colletotrichum godetiae]
MVKEQPPGVGGIEWAMIKPVRVPVRVQKGGAGRFGLMSKASASFLGRVAKGSAVLRRVVVSLDTSDYSIAVWGVCCYSGHALFRAALLH